MGGRKCVVSGWNRPREQRSLHIARMEQERGERRGGGKGQKVIDGAK